MTGAPDAIHLGVGLLQRYPPRELIAFAQCCESLGYQHLWYANEKFYRDPYVGLTLCALNTRTVRLGIFVADPYTVHPALTTIAVASVDEVSGGRAMLAYGAGGTGAAPLGISRLRPAQAIAEAVELSRLLLRGGLVDYDGELVHFRGGRLAFEPRGDIPIYVASRGDLVLSRAAEVADGVMIATYATPEGIQHGLERVARGARRAGRRTEDLDLFARVDTCITEDPREAMEAVRPMVARLLGSSYPDRSFVHALGLEVPEAFERVAERRDTALNSASAHLIPDDLVRAFTWAGNAQQVAERVAAVVDLGIRNVTIMPHPTRRADVRTTVRAFAVEVKARVEALTRR